MELVNELANRYVCGSVCLLLGIAQVVGGLRAIRTDKDFFFLEMTLAGNCLVSTKGRKLEFRGSGLLVVGYCLSAWGY